MAAGVRGDLLQARLGVPGIATLEALDPEFRDLAVSKAPVPPRSDIALVISRGFGRTNAALVIRGGRA